MDFEFEIGIRRKLVFTSCSFLTRLATIFIGREEGGHSHITTDTKKILTWAQFPLSNGGRQYTAWTTLGCWAGHCATLKLACLEGYLALVGGFYRIVFMCKSEKRK